MKCIRCSELKNEGSYKRAAVKDMEATRDYIAGRLKNPKAAKKLMTTLLKAISLLADNPYMGAALAKKFEIIQMCAILWCQSS